MLSKTETPKKSKNSWGVLLLVSLVGNLVLGCATVRAIAKLDVKIWNGGVGEITRDVIVDGQPKIEFLPCDHPQFLQYKCLSTEDADKIINAALKTCE